MALAPWGGATLRTGLLAAVSLLAAGCADGSATGPRSGAVPPGTDSAADAPTQVAAAESFNQWLAALKAEALEQGIRRRTVDQALSGIHLVARVLELDSSQPEFVRPIWAYLDSAVADGRIREGRQRLGANQALLARVSAEYGVPPEIIVAFWGVESDFGVDVGSFKVVDVLATLAFQSRRKAFFRGELLAALRILDQGDIEPERMRGSWAGAMGQTQFIPTIFLQHAVDYDGDGRRDIWGSLPDLFASTAHFVRGIGWRKGERWGEEVRLPADFPWDQAELTIKKPLAEWRRLGVRGLDGQAPEGGDQDEASILLPGGARGPAILVRENFRVIMRYNPAISYALAVALLSDRLAGRPGLSAAWPRTEQALNRKEALELQQHLARLGFSQATPDGLIGPATRTALRAFQKGAGLIPDGFATKALLERLRQS